VPRTIRLAAGDVVVVEDLLAYRRRTDTHQTAWIAYACASIVAIGLPYLSYVTAIASIPVTGGPTAKKRS
jgi:hypothetical protein